MKLAFKFVWERFPTAIKIDPPQADSMFDVGRSMFDVHSFFPTIKPAAVQASGPPAEHPKQSPMSNIRHCGKILPLTLPVCIREILL